ncbi:unnamed protein product, partial [Polarella glacialis]
MWMFTPKFLITCRWTVQGTKMMSGINIQILGRSLILDFCACPSRFLLTASDLAHRGSSRHLPLAFTVEQLLWMTHMAAGVATTSASSRSGLRFRTDEKYSLQSEFLKQKKYPQKVPVPDHSVQCVDAVIAESLVVMVAVVVVVVMVAV